MRTLFQQLVNFTLLLYPLQTLRTSRHLIQAETFLWGPDHLSSLRWVIFWPHDWLLGQHGARIWRGIGSRFFDFNLASFQRTFINFTLKRLEIWIWHILLLLWRTVVPLLFLTLINIEKVYFSARFIVNAFARSHRASFKVFTRICKIFIIYRFV